MYSANFQPTNNKYKVVDEYITDIKETKDFLVEVDAKVREILIAEEVENRLKAQKRFKRLKKCFKWLKHFFFKLPFEVWAGFACVCVIFLFICVLVVKSSLAQLITPNLVTVTYTNGKTETFKNVTHMHKQGFSDGTYDMVFKPDGRATIKDVKSWKVE